MMRDDRSPSLFQLPTFVRSPFFETLESYVHQDLRGLDYSTCHFELALDLFQLSAEGMIAEFKLYPENGWTSQLAIMTFLFKNMHAESSLLLKDITTVLLSQVSEELIAALKVNLQSDPLHLAYLDIFNKFALSLKREPLQLSQAMLESNNHFLETVPLPQGNESPVCPIDNKRTHVVAPIPPRCPLSQQKRKRVESYTPPRDR